MSLFALFVALSMILPGVPVHAVQGPLFFNGQHIGGSTYCWSSGRPEIWYDTTVDIGFVASHEYLHAIDCMDNGKMDGSLLPFLCTEGDCAHAWVYWAQSNPESALRVIYGGKP